MSNPSSVECSRCGARFVNDAQLNAHKLVEDYANRSQVPEGGKLPTEAEILQAANESSAMQKKVIDEYEAAPPSPAGGEQVERESNNPRPTYELEAILTKLRRGGQAKSMPYSIWDEAKVAEALQAIEQLYNQRFEAALGADEEDMRVHDWVRESFNNRAAEARERWYTKESNHE